MICPGHTLVSGGSRHQTCIIWPWDLCSDHKLNLQVSLTLLNLSTQHFLSFCLTGTCFQEIVMIWFKSRIQSSLPPPNMFWGVHWRHFEKLDRPSPGRLKLDPPEAHVGPIRVDPPFRQLGAEDKGKKVRLLSRPRINSHVGRHFRPHVWAGDGLRLT